MKRSLGSVAVLVAALGLAGCTQLGSDAPATGALGSGAGAGDGKGGQAMTDSQGAVTLVAERRPDGRVAIAVRNAGPSAIAILAAGPVAPGGDPDGGPKELAGERGADGSFVYRVTHMQDDPGVQARAPMPDRLEVEPAASTDAAAEVALCTVVAAGGTFAEELALEGRAHVAVRYVALTEGVTALRLDDPTMEPGTPPDPSARAMGGWVEVARYSVTARPIGAADEGTSGDAPAWPVRQDQGLVLGERPRLPALQRQALWAADLARLPVVRLEAAAP